VFEKARELGLVNMTVPREFGGSGWGLLDLHGRHRAARLGVHRHRRRAGLEFGLRRRVSRRRTHKQKSEVFSRLWPENSVRTR
jgi:alkylation response protein AidB-like acyl-CoA dehydrogenase